MAGSEYERLQKALERSASDEAMRTAADAMREYLASSKERRISLKAKRKGSTPTLVNLGLRKPYPKSIPLEDIPDQMEKNPELYKLLQKVITTK